MRILEASVFVDWIEGAGGPDCKEGTGLEKTLPRAASRTSGHRALRIRMADAHDPLLRFRHFALIYGNRFSGALVFPLRENLARIPRVGSRRLEFLGFGRVHRHRADFYWYAAE